MRSRVGGTASKLTFAIDPENFFKAHRGINLDHAVLVTEESMNQKSTEVIDLSGSGDRIRISGPCTPCRYSPTLPGHRTTIDRNDRPGHEIGSR